MTGFFQALPDRFAENRIVLDDQHVHRSTGDCQVGFEE
jgi:hypothetical protein